MRLKSISTSLPSLMSALRRTRQYTRMSQVSRVRMMVSSTIPSIRALFVPFAKFVRSERRLVGCG
jgi:hypothetical protein